MKTLQWCFVAAFCGCLFGGWPFAAGFSRMGPGWTTTLVTAGTFGVCATALAARPEHFEVRSIIYLLIAGLMNGVGTVYYGKLILQKDVSHSIVFSLVAATAALVLGIGGMISQGETITPIRAFGVVMISCGVYFVCQH